MQLKAGFFWYYFESNPAAPLVMADLKYPCMDMSFKKDGVFPFRVKAYKNRIAVEFSHILTDGMGAISFLKALVAEYLQLSGVKIKDWGDIIKANDKPLKKEWEDVTRVDIEELVYQFIQKYSSNGKETHHIRDHKKF